MRTSGSMSGITVSHAGNRPSARADIAAANARGASKAASEPAIVLDLAADVADDAAKIGAQLLELLSIRLARLNCLARA
jgi:hypothetical protein